MKKIKPSYDGILSECLVIFSKQTQIFENIYYSIISLIVLYKSEL